MKNASDLMDLVIGSEEPIIKNDYEACWIEIIIQ